MNRPLPSRISFDRWRLFTFYGIIILVFGVFVLRLLNLQVFQGGEYLARAENNRITTISEPTQRGLIYDRNGTILAQNVASFNVIITPAELPLDPGAVQEVYRQVSNLTGVPVSQGNTEEDTVKAFKPCDNDLGITQIVYIQDTNAPYTPVQVKCNVDQKTAMTLQEKSSELPGVGIEIVPIREYPTGYLTAEVVGFLGPIPAAYEKEYREQGFIPNRDKVGFGGVELTFDDYLIGQNGKRVVEVDVAGKVIRDLEEPTDPIPGYNVRLTLDSRLQSAAKTALVNQMDYWNRRFPDMGLSNGVVIAMNPKTGEVLALVSEPTFENNRMARQIPAYYYNQLSQDPQKPLFNHAISAEHPPGSVFKLAASIGVLNEGLITPDQLIDDPGQITLTEKYSPNDPGLERPYVCYIYKQTGGGHGKLDFLSGFALSCDVYFYKISGGYEDEVPEGLGIQRLREYARALGYDELTGIELPGEATGLIPDPDWKRLNVGENWSTGDTYIAGIGQGYVLSTPLQVLMSAAIIANDGKQVKPTLLKEVVDADGKVVKTATPTIVKDITKEPVITIFDERGFATSEKKVVESWVVDLVKQAMRKVVVDGTASTIFEGMSIPTAGKTGTAEYCDNVAQANNRCTFGNWPAHAWYVGYAPFDDPEIAVVAFVYNGGEGSTVAAPIVRQVMETYFELKAIDAAK